MVLKGGSYLTINQMFQNLYPRFSIGKFLLAFVMWHVLHPLANTLVCCACSSESVSFCFGLEAPETLGRQPIFIFFVCLEERNRVRFENGGVSIKG